MVGSLRREFTIRWYTQAAVILLAACGGDGGGCGSGPKPIAPISLQAGASYFSIGGRQQFLASRNVFGRSAAEVDGLLDDAASAGMKLVRFHVTHLGGLGITPAGEVDETWASAWDAVFDRAQDDGIYVIPVFGVWADWNDGTNPAVGWHNWANNPLNAANGGPAVAPTDLYTADSAGQKAWLAWLAKLVGRWQAHQNVAAWELFSELDLVTHTGGNAAFESGGVAFATVAGAAIRTADLAHRPVTASLAIWDAWYPDLYTSTAVDIAQVHMYSKTLDLSVAEAIDQLRTLGKPVLVGESGLDARSPAGDTVTMDPGVERFTRHAVWMELFSGAMNGRALWWEDGYAMGELGDDAVSWVAGYSAVEGPALALLGGRDLGGAAPLPVAMSGALLGAAYGIASSVLGWARASSCATPEAAECGSPVTGAMSITVVGTAANWTVRYRQPASSTTVTSSATLPQTSSVVLVPLESVEDDVAFELVPAS